MNISMNIEDTLLFHINLLWDKRTVVMINEASRRFHYVKLYTGLTLITNFRVRRTIQRD